MTDAGDVTDLVPLGLLRTAGAECGGAVIVRYVGSVGLEGWTGDARWAVDELCPCRLIAVLGGTAHGAGV